MKREGALAPPLVVAFAVFVTLFLAPGCGGTASETLADPFGTPPAPAPGVHAWAAGEVGTLLVTADGGASWGRQRFYLPQRGVDVTFSDVRTGWLVTDGGTVLATTDGGKTWTVVEKAALDMKAIAAAGAGAAWIVGNATGAAGDPGTAAVLRTKDGGVTWRRTAFGDAMLADVAFADPRHGVLVALDRIWTTRDGGRTWKLRRQVRMTVLTSVSAGDPRHAWVAGWSTQDGAPLVFATDDGGVRWRRLRVAVPSAAAGELQARQIVSAGGSSLWLTCDAGVLATRDGGRTWELQHVAAGRPRAIAVADERHLLATTATQPVLATSDGGATWLAFGADGLLRQPLVAIAAVATTDAQ